MRLPEDVRSVARYVIVGVLVGLVMPGCSYVRLPTAVPPPVTAYQAYLRIPQGIPRSEALELLADAECHISCPSPSGAVYDLFFYRVCDLERGEALELSSRTVTDTLRVYLVGTLDYPHLWNKECLAKMPPAADQEP